MNSNDRSISPIVVLLPVSLVFLLLAAMIVYPWFIPMRYSSGPSPRKKAIDARVRSAYRFYDSGKQAYKQKDMRSAETDFQQSLQVDAQNPEVWCALANLLYEEHRDEEALRAYRLALLPHQNWTSPLADSGRSMRKDRKSLLRYGLLCEKAGNTQEANDAYRRIPVRVDVPHGLPSLPAPTQDLRHNKALAYITLGLLSELRPERMEALSYYEQAVQAQPNMALAQYYLGRGLQESGRPAEAKAAFWKAAALGHGEVKIAAQRALQQLEHDLNRVSGSFRPLMVTVAQAHERNLPSDHADRTDQR